MILQRLHELAKRQGLLDADAIDFEEGEVPFVVRVDREGTLVRLETRAARVKTKGLPRLPIRSGTGVQAGFLSDKSQYALRVRKDGTDADRARRCAEKFRELVERAARDVDDEGLTAVKRFLARDEEIKKACDAARDPKAKTDEERARPYAWTGDERVAFVLASDDETLVHERDAVQQWWQQNRALIEAEYAGKRSREGSAAAGAGVEFRCLVTGELCEPRSKHGLVKRLPGYPNGARVVSSNDESVLSQGGRLNSGDNAPMSDLAADGYVRALNWLLDKDGDRVHRQGIGLGDETVVVFWTRAPNDAVAVVQHLGQAPRKPKGRGATARATAEDLRAAAQSPWKGLARQSTDDTAFFALTLGTSTSRVVIRDWFEAKAGEIKDNLRRWFEELRIAGQDEHPAPLFALVRALMVRPDARIEDELPPDLAARMFRAALTGAALPRTLLPRALRRMRVVQPGERDRLRLCCALIKAVLVRSHPDDADWRITVALDETNTRPAYVLGRLFALLERMQAAAVGSLNATIRDRYFGAASMSPALVFPRLLALGMHHAAALRKDGTTWLEGEKAKVIGLLPATGFPRTLDLEEQGLFAVGYYHQRERLFGRRDDRPAS